MRSFFATLKNELVTRRPWASRYALRIAVFEYIEVFYNSRRLHSSLNYKTPAEVEQDGDVLEHANRFIAMMTALIR